MPIAAAATNSLKITEKKSRGGSSKSHIISKPFPPGGAILVAKVVPESCQRTDGIDAWLEIKTEKDNKRMEREERQRDRKKILNDITEERNTRNAERQKSFELKQLKKLVKEDSFVNQEMIKEKETIIKDLDEIIDKRGSTLPSCDNCAPCKNSKEVCKCFCRSCEETRRESSEKPAKSNSNRGPVRCVKKIRGKRGKPDTIEYIVNIELDQYEITKDQLADFREIFTLFDKDGDGVLTFNEVTAAMKTFGQRIPEAALKEMIQQVSEDKENNTLEFNEYLTMMGLQNIEDIKFSALHEAFRVFDKDKDGFLTVNELRKIMTTMGKKMKKNEVEEMVLEADIAKNGLINLQDFCSLLIYGPKTVMLQKSSKLGRKRIQDKCRDDYSSRSGSFSQG